MSAKLMRPLSPNELLLLTGACESSMCVPGELAVTEASSCLLRSRPQLNAALCRCTRWCYATTDTESLGVKWLLTAPLVLAGIVILGLACLQLFGNRPAYHRHRTLAAYEPALQQLAGLMQVGAIYIIERERSAAFLQFVRDAEGLRFAFPDAPWSRDQFEAVVRELGRAGVRAEVGSEDGAEVRRFLAVELRGTAEEVGAEAVRVARLAAAAMGIPEEDRFKGHYEGGMDPGAYLEHWGPQYERVAATAPRPIRWVLSRHLRTMRQAAGQTGSPPPAA